MRAVVRDTYGTPDVLAVKPVEVPTIADDEVLVEVRGAGLDRGVWHIMAGLPYLGRLAFGVRRPKLATLGREAAGVVASPSTPRRARTSWPAGRRARTTRTSRR